jgi:para-nitrobenzyl esterase
LGAVHAAEVPYVFNNLGEKPLFPDGSDPVRAAASPDDQKVADLMSSYWVNFARNGDPNGPGLPAWKPHEVGNSDTAIILDAHPETETLPPKERLQAIDAQFQAARGGN